MYIFVPVTQLKRLWKFFHSASGHRVPGLLWLCLWYMSWLMIASTLAVFVLCDIIICHILWKSKYSVTLMCGVAVAQPLGGGGGHDPVRNDTKIWPIIVHNVTRVCWLVISARYEAGYKQAKNNCQLTCLLYPVSRPKAIQCNCDEMCNFTSKYTKNCLSTGLCLDPLIALP